MLEPETKEGDGAAGASKPAKKSTKKPAKKK